MNTLTQLALSFPMVVFTLLIALIALYWLLVCVRLAPLELFERDSLRDDSLASAMVSLGFIGVPIMLSLTLLVVLSGVIIFAIEVAVLQHLALGLFRVPLGAVLIWAAVALASPVVALLCRRLRRHFHGYSQLPRCLLGETVVVGAVEEGPLRDAVLVDHESHHLTLRIKAGQEAIPGERRVLVKYLRDQDAYRSVAEHDYLDARARLVKLKLINRDRQRERLDAS
nr:hypothetical protein [Halomonas halocynthiae]